VVPHHQEQLAGLVHAIQSLKEAQVENHREQTQVNQTLQAQVNSLQEQVKSLEAGALTLSEQQPALLPVDVLLRLELQHQLGALREFRLNAPSESLKEFVDHFKNDDGVGDYDQNQVIWIGDGAFIRVGADPVVGDGFYGECTRTRFHLSLNNLSLNIHSKTLDEAMGCLDFLFGLSDSHFGELVIYYNADSNEH
jgi:hypothetical protein